MLIKEFDFLTEGVNTQLVIVDYQSAYDPWISRMSGDLMAYVNAYKGPIFAFYNGEQEDEWLDDVQQYWIANGCNEESLDKVVFHEKSYGWLRGWMDRDIPPDIIIKVLRYMYLHHIEHSSDIKDDEWDKILPHKDIVNYQDIIDDPFSSIWLPNFSLGLLKMFNKCYICGGGRHECLREIELMMNAFNFKYKRLERFIF